MPQQLLPIRRRSIGPEPGRPQSLSQRHAGGLYRRDRGGKSKRKHQMALQLLVNRGNVEARADPRDLQAA